MVAHGGICGVAAFDLGDGVFEAFDGFFGNDKATGRAAEFLGDFGGSESAEDSRADLRATWIVAVFNATDTAILCV